MSPTPQGAMRCAVIGGVLIEAPIVLGVAGLAVVSGDVLWAIGAAALGTAVLFVLLAQAKKDRGR